MPIIFHEEQRIFHLTNKYVSYIIRVMENDQLENLYYGKRIHDREDFANLHETCWRSQMSIVMPDPSNLSMQYARQEYPFYGTGDYRAPAATVLQKNGSRVVDFKFESFSIRPGKPELPGLPATYVESIDEADTLEITLVDKLSGTELVLSYTIYEDYPVITRHARFLQVGDDPVVLERALSMSVEFLDMDYEMVQLSGAWGRERYVHTRKLDMGIQSIQGLAGTTGGAEQNPFAALKRKETTEQAGEVYGFSLVYSGNFLAQVEVSTFDMTRVTMGIHPENFAWKLEKGETFVTPEVVMVYSDKGMNGMSQVFHRLYRTRLARGEWRDKERPILLNNWEGTYFDFTEEKLLAMARKAKEVGVERRRSSLRWRGRPRKSALNSLSSTTAGSAQEMMTTAVLETGIATLRSCRPVSTVCRRRWRRSESSSVSGSSSRWSIRTVTFTARIRTGSSMCPDATSARQDTSMCWIIPGRKWSTISMIWLRRFSPSPRFLISNGI